ncbi:RDD family protein [Nostoc sp. UHCC 0702]|nr:RDD family protein [Nostoc sp. UHCC 0702]
MIAFSRTIVNGNVTNLNGNKISFDRATGRYFGKYISTMTFLIGYIMAAYTKKKQALHDILAGTLVINKS